MAPGEYEAQRYEWAVSFRSKPKWQDLGQARTNAPWYQTEEAAANERAEWRRDWTKRVNELHEMANDAYTYMPATMADYEDASGYVNDLFEYVTEGERFDRDEIRVIRAQIERLVSNEEGDA